MQAHVTDSYAEKVYGDCLSLAMAAPATDFELRNRPFLAGPTELRTGVEFGE
jgi:hypothetical protein